MYIADNVLKYYLRNAYFLTGTAYAGKSTSAKLLAERYDLALCGENYFSRVSDVVATPEQQPNLSYIPQLKNWEDFVRRSPEEYERWIYATGEEAAGFEIAELIALSQNRRVIVDTNIPLHVLHAISDYDHVAVMLSPQSLSVDRFFDRNDPEKRFLLGVIEGCIDAQSVMQNYRAGLERINSQKHYDEYANSGFFTLVREDDGKDTRNEVCEKLARHFGLTS